MAKEEKKRGRGGSPLCRLSPLESFLETSQFQLLESLSLFVQGTPNRSVFFISLGGAAPPEARASLCAARERSRAIWKSPALIRSESSIELVEQEGRERFSRRRSRAPKGRALGARPAAHIALSLSAASFARVSRSGFPKACDCQKPAKRALPTDGQFALSLSPRSPPPLPPLSRSLSPSIPLRTHLHLFSSNSPIFNVKAKLFPPWLPSPRSSCSASGPTRTSRYE